MTFTQKNEHKVFDINDIAEKEWECENKGLKKVLIDYKYKCMTKATEISKCLVEIFDVENINGRESKYLQNSKNSEFWIELGSALTPIDCYVEIFLQHMLTGETSRCSIKTKKPPPHDSPIQFTLRLNKIEFVNYLFRLNPKQMYDLALKYKDNGVAMFKKYPIFAKEYFCRAAKCLISFKPFDGLTEKVDYINPEQMQQLLETVQLNIAACLIKEKNYDNVIFLTQFVDERKNVSEKAIFRRAVAFYNLKRFEEAKSTLEKYDNYKDNKELFNLYNKILCDWKLERNKYNQVIKRMFQ